MSFTTSHSFDCSDDDDDNSHQKSSVDHDRRGVANSDASQSIDGEAKSKNLLASDMLFAGMGNIAAACDAANAASRKHFRSEEAKQHARRHANRRSAKMSRDRKRMESDELQAKANQLAQSNFVLTKENQVLKEQIAGLMERLSSGAQVEKSGGIGGSMTGMRSMGQQDLLSLQYFQQQHALPFNREQAGASAGERSIASPFRLHSMMSPNAALVQGTQLAANTLQLETAALLQQYNQMGVMAALDDASETSMGFDDRDAATAKDRSKRQKTNRNDFM